MTTSIVDLSQAIDNLTATALKVKAERDKLYGALANIIFVLDDAQKQLGNLSDITDSGGPNWAMKLLQMAEQYERLL